MPFSTDTLLVLALYGGLGFTYLIVVPAALLFYLKERWYDVSSVERFLLYMLVFAFFPGMLVMSPFVNFRPHPRSLNNPGSLNQQPYERI
ncbi:NAD(P)H-quinone oxidoreductase subunit L [filamentous cyanobacterium CCP5]|nr:NAD(P)H-quinone oxidoreductase subunit L [filamentous cyanobacterium CCP5]